MDIKYNIVHGRPVKIALTEDGGITVMKYNYKTGQFEYGMEYLTRATFGGEDIEHVSEDEFIQYVEGLRCKKFADREGSMYDLYAVINGIEDIAREKGRDLKQDEKDLIASIKRQTYQWFETEKPRA